MNDNILKVVKHYGILKQLKYMSTEQFELDEAIIRYELIEESGLFRSSDECEERNHIVEELVDNLFMLKQIQLYYEITDEEIEEVMNYKINRQLERIENEKTN